LKPSLQIGLFVFIPSKRALAFTARDTISPPTYFVGRTVFCKAVSVKPHSLCKALLLQELLLMTTGFVAEFSFCVPRAAMNNVVY